MRATLLVFVTEDRGEDLIEYGLMAAFVAAVAIAAVISDPLSLKPALLAAYNRVIAALTNS